MDLSKAYISHFSPNRLRIKIPDKKGDETYFKHVKKAFAEKIGQKNLETNPLTGSILFVHSKIVVEDISEVGKSNRLFQLEWEKGKKNSLSKPVAQSLGKMNEKITAYSGETFDLWELLFMGMLGFGVFEIVRGNFRSPPWYTFFWYAFGIYTKSMVDKASKMIQPHGCKT